MFGKNPVRDNEAMLDGMLLAVQEVFYTIQGEGPQSGRPCPFIRLAGCNLACTFCDTEFESNIDNRLPLSAILDLIKDMPRRDLVVLTGGEPMRQNIVPLIDALIGCGVQLVQIETAGTCWVPGLEVAIGLGHVQLVVSPKTPRIHHLVSKWCEHYKYVIQAGRLADDGLPGYGTQQATLQLPRKLYRPADHDVVAELGRLTGKFPTVWVSPCDEHNEHLTKLNVEAAVSSAMKHGHRLSLQTHKIVNVP